VTLVTTRERSTVPDYPPDAACLHHLFAWTQRQHADRVAVSGPQGDVTYRELDRLSTELARRLRSMGVNRNVLVGLCTDRSVEMIVGMIAIMKAGGAYVPIDPTYPERRIQFLLADSGVSTVVTVADVADTLKNTGITPVLVGRKSESPSDSDADGWLAEGSSEDLAYVIYTSGSTGTPKGVMVEHRNVVRLFSELQPWFGFTCHDVWTVFHSVSFDFSVWEIWGALLYGGRLVIVPHDVSRSPERFHAMVRKERVSVLSQTPSAFRQLVAVDRRHEPLELRYVVLGGEALDVSMLALWFERYGDQRVAVVNMYGITETTVHVTYRRMRQSDVARPNVSPIGMPIPDLRIHLLDDARRPVTDGTAGEMYVEGPGLARGYWGRPRLNSERFIEDEERSARLYRSGDRAVKVAGGELLYLGRTDDQLKIRGFRVEPREIEACLGAHTHIAAAVVVGEELGEGDQRLKAYVLPQSGFSFTPARIDALRAELTLRAAEELPTHMRPSSYVIVRSIPLTAHGKVDRRALKSVEDELGITSVGSDEMSPVESRIARIWKDVLQITGFGLHDDCFDLGATSLGVVRMIAKINEEFRVSLNGIELDDAPTIAALAKCVRQQLEAGRGDSLSDSRQAYLDEPAPSGTKYD
jgi:amino acid adenylation domain-containing protein